MATRSLYRPVAPKGRRSVDFDELRTALLGRMKARPEFWTHARVRTFNALLASSMHDHIQSMVLHVPFAARMPLGWYEYPSLIMHGPDYSIDLAEDEIPKEWINGMTLNPTKITAIRDIMFHNLPEEGSDEDFRIFLILATFFLVATSTIILPSLKPRELQLLQDMMESSLEVGLLTHDYRYAVRIESLVDVILHRDPALFPSLPRRSIVDASESPSAVHLLSDAKIPHAPANEMDWATSAIPNYQPHEPEFATDVPWADETTKRHPMLQPFQNSDSNQSHTRRARVYFQPDHLKRLRNLLYTRKTEYGGSLEISRHGFLEVTSVRKGQFTSVDVPWTRMVWHIHPRLCRSNTSGGVCALEVPSAFDIVSTLRAQVSKENKVHFIFTALGTYRLQLRGHMSTLDLDKIRAHFLGIYNKFNDRYPKDGTLKKFRALWLRHMRKYFHVKLFVGKQRPYLGL